MESTIITVIVVVVVVGGGLLTAYLMKTSKPPPVRRKTILDRTDKNFFLDLAQRKPPTLESPRPHDLTKPPE